MDVKSVIPIYPNLNMSREQRLAKYWLIYIYRCQTRIVVFVNEFFKVLIT